MRTLVARPSTLHDLMARCMKQPTAAAPPPDEAVQFHTLKIITELATDGDST